MRTRGWTKVMAILVIFCFLSGQTVWAAPKSGQKPVKARSSSTIVVPNRKLNSSSITGFTYNQPYTPQGPVKGPNIHCRKGEVCANICMYGPMVLGAGAAIGVGICEVGAAACVGCACWEAIEIIAGSQPLAGKTLCHRVVDWWALGYFD